VPVCTNCSIWWFRFISEKDATAEVGFEAAVLDRKLSKCSSFSKGRRRCIGFDWWLTNNFNVNGKAKRSWNNGLHVLNDKVKFNANYTFTELERQSRILNPKHKSHRCCRCKQRHALLLMWVYQFVSDRYLEYTTYQKRQLGDPCFKHNDFKDYQLVNTNVRYELM
jgi:vitamin B12 transporter